MSDKISINADRLLETIYETARFGGLPNGGVARLTLSRHDRDVRDWLGRQCAELGLTVVVDEVGNMFATRPGQDSGTLPIAMGSHLDTQPTGGKYDGILGVLGALEVLRTLHETGVTTHAPLTLVNWTNEEGSRFSPAMLGSGTYAGVYSPDYAYARRDVQGRTFGEALDDIGYRGDAAAGSVQLGALFELHIEQGPILEAEGAVIGVVRSVQGLNWYEVELTGRAAHTGSTPMAMRQDALLAAARIVESVNRTALDHAPHAVGSVGFIEAHPNSNNVIPGFVRLTIDLRHPDDAVLARMAASVERAIGDAAAATGVTAEFRKVGETAAVSFDPQCIEAVREAAAALGHASRDIVSGAGHDSVHLARIVPTTMIFVPSAGGLSHNEAESTSPQECAAGVQVLLDAVLAYDRRAAANRIGNGY